MNVKWTLHAGAFLCAVILLGIILWIIPSSLAPQKVNNIKGIQEKKSGFYPNLTSGDQAEIDFVSSIQREDQITIFGSSEFSGSAYCPFNFFPNRLHKPALGLGHAHHQHLAILGELAAVESSLENSKITILISPTWFNTSGTNSSAFIEFMRPNFLKRIVSNSNLNPDYKALIGKSIHENYNEFNGVFHDMEVLRDVYLKKHGWFFQKWMSSLRSYLKNKFSHRYYTENVRYEPSFERGIPLHHNILWKKETDSLKTAFLGGITTNELFVNDDYFQTYLKQKDGSVKSGKFKPVDLNKNREFEDFKAVVRLLHEKKADAHFIILPINPYFYTGMENASNLTRAIQSELDSKNMPYLNLFSDSKDTYDPGTLKDVMHLGDYGWMKINKYLSQHYHE